MKQRHPSPATASSGAPLGELSDDALIHLVSQGDKAAFELLFRRHRDLVCGMATRYLDSRVLGREVTQDVFLAIWAERERYQAQGRFRSYLVSVALHRCQHLARQRKSDAVKAESVSMQVSCFHESKMLDELVENEQTRTVREKLAALPDPLREVMVLRFAGGLKLQEIAEATGSPLGTVKVRVFRGLKELHKMLKEQE